LPSAETQHYQALGASTRNPGMRVDQSLRKYPCPPCPCPCTVESGKGWGRLAERATMEDPTPRGRVVEQSSSPLMHSARARARSISASVTAGRERLTSALTPQQPQPEPPQAQGQAQAQVQQPIAAPAADGATNAGSAPTTPSTPATPDPMALVLVDEDPGDDVLSGEWRFNPMAAFARSIEMGARTSSRLGAGVRSLMSPRPSPPQQAQMAPGERVALCRHVCITCMHACAVSFVAEHHALLGARHS
jgi:hypothetical protein